MHEDLREGMAALTASISAVHESQVEGAEAVKASFDGQVCNSTDTTLQLTTPA